MSPKEILRRDAWTVRAPRIDYGAGASVKEPSVTWLRSCVTRSLGLRSPGPGAVSVKDPSVTWLRSCVTRSLALRSPGPGALSVNGSHAKSGMRYSRSGRQEQESARPVQFLAFCWWYHLGVGTPFSHKTFLLNPARYTHCLLYTSPSPRDATLSRMPSSA